MWITHLDRLINGHKLPVFFGDDGWAIGGGAVRDLALLPHITEGFNGSRHQEDVIKSIVDIDIIMRAERYAYWERVTSKRSGFNVIPNRFGGTRLLISSLNSIEIDVFSENTGVAKTMSNMIWTDFGVNAISAEYSHGHIDLHIGKRWIEDVAAQRVERQRSVMDATPTDRGIGALRSCHLINKLSRNCGGFWKLGNWALNEIKWLGWEADADTVDAVYRYLEKKIDTNRWSYHVLGDLMSSGVYKVQGADNSLPLDTYFKQKLRVLCSKYGVHR